MKRTGRITEEIVNFKYQSKSTEELLQQFLNAKQAQNLSSETIKIYRFHGRIFCRYLGDRAKEPAWKVCDLECYNGFILWLQNSDRKDITITSFSRSVRTWFYWMMDNNCIARFRIKIPRYQKTIPAVYSDEELKVLLKQPSKNCTEVEYETWVFINLAIGTGLRLSSMTSIHVEDIMFSENTIVVNKTKNRNGLLLVINDELLAILETYIRLFHLDSEDYLFSTGNGTKLANRTMEDFVNRYSAKRGISKSHVIHAFRHTFARNFYLQNHDMYRLKELMGHTLISTTENYLRSLGMDTTKKIEYNPQAQFIVAAAPKTKKRSKHIHSSF